MQFLATLLFYIVFLELFAALAIYIAASIRAFLRKEHDTTHASPSLPPPPPSSPF